jgi:hypothetical protein
MTLEKEAESATQLLAGKVVQLVWRHRPGEVVVQFTDGTRLFANVDGIALELSVTDGGGEE